MIPAPPEIRERLCTLLRRDLHVDVPSADVELIGSGIIDSLQLVELLAGLEMEFEITVPVADVDIENFRTVDALAAFVGRLLALSAKG